VRAEPSSLVAWTVAACEKAARPGHSEQEMHSLPRYVEDRSSVDRFDGSRDVGELGAAKAIGVAASTSVA
jgi:hypothetical protein